MKDLQIIEADFSNSDHTDAILYLTDQYAQDPMGLDGPLPDQIRKNLIDEMKDFSGSFSLLAFYKDQPAGLANCIYSFSTFNAAKVINIHDLVVQPDFRGMGIGEALLSLVEEKAVQANCCKITLEVREDNRARNLYKRVGFEYGSPAMYFMNKYL